jgi:N-acetylglucosamine-6-sulfatase
MRSHSISLFLLVVACGLARDTSATQPALKRPNIVFILVDDLRHDTFGFMGHSFLETPHIDALAANGTQFTNAFVTTSLCSPSRASFLTGQYTHHHKVVGNSDSFPKGTQTFPESLQRANYETAFVGKWHMGSSSSAPRAGFDHWVSFRGQGTYSPERQTINVNGKELPRRKYVTDELTDYAVEWLADRDGDKPFLLYLAHKGVHGLYDPAPRHRDRYQDVKVKLPATMAIEHNRDKPLWVQDQRNSWHGVEYPYYGRSKQSLTEMYKHYCEMILSIDDSVGQIMQTLRDNGLDRNTLVVFTSDGGHLWGEHGLIDKRCAYEPSMRIPLIIHGADRFPKGAKIEALVANIDLAPTLLEFAGIPVAEEIDGKSLSPLASGDRGRSSLLYEYYWEPQFPQTPTTFALRDKQFKLVQYHGIWDTDELYDLVNDPQETRNLIDARDQQERVTRMRRQLHESLKESGGLVIPLGFKRNHGSNLRRKGGTTRARFPAGQLSEP